MLKKDFKNKFDLAKPRRKYFSDDCGLTWCPECGSSLVAENCTVLLAAKSDADEGEFMSNLTGSHFCQNCPVIIFDSEKLENAARIGIRDGENLKFLVKGIVDLNAIPQDKRHLEIGIDENPVPLVLFLPDLKKATVANKEKTGRNDPCPCGSGKKYKKCCG